MFYSRKDGKFFINVRATTKASKNYIRGVKNDELLISVTAVPENNKANNAIIDLISKKIGVSKSKIQIISGEKNRNKKISIDSENIEEILSSLSILKS